MPDRLQVACATDSSYLPHCAAMLASLIEQQKGEVDIHVFASPSMRDGDLTTLTDWVEGLGAGITVVRPDEDRLAGAANHFSVTSWYRVLVPEALAHLDRVLYIDVDTIVTDSLDPLWETDLEGNLIGAVTNLPMYMEWMERRCAWLGIPSVDGYFNAGVMLMDLDGLRGQGIPQEVIAFSEANGDDERDIDESSPREVFTYVVHHPDRLLFPDQDALNSVLHERRLPIHPRWNQQLLFTRFETRTAELTDEVIAEAVANPAIRHFEGPGHSKPWHPDSEPPDRELYEAHSRRTPWG